MYGVVVRPGLRPRRRRLTVLVSYDEALGTVWVMRVSDRGLIEV